MARKSAAANDFLRWMHGWAISQDVGDGWLVAYKMPSVQGEIPGEQICFFRQEGTQQWGTRLWHAFYRERATGSGTTPLAALTGGLGDVILNDHMMRTYCRKILAAPRELVTQFDGLYEAQVQCRNEGVRETDQVSAQVQEKVMARKPIQEMIAELRSWLPNYDHGPNDYPTLVWSILASAPGGDEAEGLGYPTFNIGWHEIEQLGRMLEVIQDKRDVEELVAGLMSDVDPEDENPDEPTIERITSADVRTYPDSGQTIATVEWIDSRGSSGSAKGDPKNAHMQALLARAKREGVPINTDAPLRPKRRARPATPATKRRRSR